MLAHRLVVLATLLPFASVVSASEPTRARGDLAIQARAILRTHCGACHHGGEGSRGRVVAADYDSLTRANTPAHFLEPGSDRSQILELIEDGSMPPGDRKRPTAEELKLLRKWAVEEKAPKYPKTFDETSVAELVKADRQKLPASEQAAARYVSFRHLIADDAPLPPLNTHESKLWTALFAASNKRLNAWEYVDDAATVLRLVIRNPGWDDPNLFWKVENEEGDKVADFTPYDLLLLENPFAARAAEAKPTYLSGLRQTPFLRGDWLADILHDGKQLTPLGDDLAALSDLSAALAKGAKKPDGPVFRPFARAEGQAHPLGSWVYSETRSLDGLAVEKATAISMSGGKPIQTVKKGDVFRLRFCPSHDAHLDLLQVDPSGVVMLRRLPAECQSAKGGVTIQIRPDGMFGAFSFDELPKGVDTAPAWMILFTSVRKEKMPPLPTVVKSKHLNSPVWRVFPTAADAATTTVRTIIKLDVTRN